MSYADESLQALRDRFAEAAMHAFLSSKELMDIVVKLTTDHMRTDETYRTFAQMSYSMADAMLAEREKKA